MNSLSSLSPPLLLSRDPKLNQTFPRRPAARAGAGGLAVICFSFVSLLPSRLSHSPSICTMSLARVWSCCALRCRGIRLWGSLCFLWGVGEEVEWWVMTAVGFYGFSVGRSQILVDCLSDLDGPYNAGFCPLLLCASVDFTTTLAGCGLEYAGGLVLEVSLSRVGYEALVFVLKYTLVLNVSLPWQVKAFSSSNFSSPVLGDYRRSVVLVSFADALSRLVFAHFPASLRQIEVGVLGRFCGSRFVSAGTMKSSASCSQTGHYL
ncbi:hypothetical protein YC2023_084217 [Brassica napus]